MQREDVERVARRVVDSLRADDVGDLLRASDEIVDTSVSRAIREFDRPSAPETMAWAVVDPVAGVRSAFISRLAARRNAQEGDKIRRVELSWRVVEDGTD